jgi:hypothetical protein
LLFLTLTSSGAAASVAGAAFSSLVSSDTCLLLTSSC